MIRTIANPVLPKPPKSLKDILSWAVDFVSKLEPQLKDIRDVINTGSQGAGTDIASAPSITPNAYLHQVTGKAVITQINNPLKGSGALVLKSVDGFSLGPGGNIAIMAPTMIPPNQATQLVYHGTTGMWQVAAGPGPFTPTTLTAHGVLIGEGTNPIVGVGPLANGQLLIGSSGADPVAAAPTAGTGINLTSGPGVLTITNSGVTSIVAGTGIGVSGATGAVTVNNIGIVTLTGTANQVTVTAGSNPTLALATDITGPNSITLATFAKLTPILFAARPGAPALGMICCFSDSTVNTWGSTIAGTGANKVLGFFNGTNWTVFAA